MAVTAQELNIILTARDREFSQAMERNQRRVEKFAAKSQKNLSKTTKSFGALAGAMRGLLPALGATLLIGSVKRALGALDEIGKTADNLGLTTDALQELRVVAESSGLEFSEFTKAFQKFTVGIGEANTGTGTARDAFLQMGVAIRDANGNLKSSEQLFNETAEALKGFSSESDRAAIAADLFGARVGVKMLNLLRNGADGMAQMRKEARDLGIVIDESLIRKAEEAQTQLDLMSRVISANLSVALIELAPLLVSTAGLVASLSKGVAAFAAAVATIPNLGGKALGNGEVTQEINDLLDAIDRFPEAAASLDVLATKMGNVRTEFGQASSEFKSAAAELKAAQNQLLQRHRETAIDDNGLPASFNAGLAALRAQIDAKREEIRLSGMSAEAIAKEAIFKKKLLMEDNLLAEAQRGNITLTMEQIDALFEVSDAWEAEALAALAASKATRSVGGAAKNAAEGLSEAEIAAQELEIRLAELAARAEREFAGVADQMQSSMEGAFMSMIDGTASAKDAFRSMARDIIAELYRVLVVQQLVGQFKTGGGGFLGAIAPIFGRAAGGPVQAGQPYTVGEHGRELFVPQGAGRILSVPQTNAALGGDAVSVVITQNLNFAEGVNAAARAEIFAAMPRIVEASKAGVLEAVRRGGAFGSVMG